MPGITNQLTATEAARVVSHNVLIGHDADVVGGETDRDHLIGPLGRYAVAIPIRRHQALGAHPAHVIDMTFETGRDGNQSALFFIETLRDAA